MSQTKPLKILLIRMISLADVATIGVPALKYFKQQYPDAEFTFLTFAQGAEIIQLAEPDTKVIQLAKNEWPDSFIPALESFLGLAETIVGEEFDQVINLDTSFMACFLARFLKDAGDQVMGNTLSMPVNDLIAAFQKQTLTSDYVNQPNVYIESSFSNMSAWFMPWWQTDLALTYGYAEYYLKVACGFNNLEMQLAIPAEPDVDLITRAKGKKIIALGTQSVPNYPHTHELKKMLEKSGYFVWLEPISEKPLGDLFALLKASDLVIAAHSDFYWFARSQQSTTLLISGATDPAMLTPDYASEITGECSACFAQLTGVLPIKSCCCIKPQTLLNYVDEIFKQEAK